MLAYIMSIIPVLVTMVVLVIILKLLSVPFRIIVKLLVNSILGAISIWAVNFFGAPFGLSIAINMVNCIIVGLTGIVGVIGIILYNKFIA